MFTDDTIAILEALEGIGQFLFCSCVAVIVANALFAILLVIMVNGCNGDVLKKLASIHQQTPEAAESAEESHG